MKIKFCLKYTGKEQGEESNSRKERRWDQEEKADGCW